MARTGIRSSAIIVKDNKILVIHRIKVGEEYWVFPGGGIEEGEAPEETIIREVKEETSLSVESMKLVFMNQTFEGENEHPFYYCEVSDGKARLGGEEKQKNSKEDFYQLEWIDLDKISKLNLVPENAKQKVVKIYKQ